MLVLLFWLFWVAESVSVSVLVCGASVVWIDSPPIVLDTCLGVTWSPNSTIKSINTVLILSGSSSTFMFKLWICISVFELSAEILSVLLKLLFVLLKVLLLSPNDCLNLSKELESTWDDISDVLQDISGEMQSDKKEEA